MIELTLYGVNGEIISTDARVAAEEMARAANSFGISLMRDQEETTDGTVCDFCGNKFEAAPPKKCPICGSKIGGRRNRSPKRLS